MDVADLLTIGAAVGLGGGAYVLYQAVIEQEREIRRHLRPRRAADLREQANALLGDIDESSGVDRAARTVESALAEADPDDIARVQRAGYVWRTNGHDGRKSSGDAEASFLGAVVATLIALAPWLLRVLALVAVILLLLISTGGERVWVLAQEPRGGHTVVQTQIPTARLAAIMRDMSRWVAERDLPTSELRWRLDSILMSHRAPDQETIEALRRRLLVEDER